MKRFAAVFLGFLVLSSMVTADPLYKWVDAQGNVHYSDKPQPGAKKIVLPKASTYTPPKATTPPPPPPDNDRGQAADAPYTAVTISSPADQATIWNTDTVTVSVTVAPALHPGDSVTISLDNQTQTVTGTSATFSGLERGPHTVSASLGSLAATPITFYIQKTSKIKPPSH